MASIDPDSEQRFEVRIHEGDELVHTAHFADLEEAEAFAEEWAERVPGARAEFEDLSHTPELSDVVEQDTAITEDYPRPSEED